MLTAEQTSILSSGEIRRILYSGHKIFPPINEHDDSEDTFVLLENEDTFVQDDTFVSNEHARATAYCGFFFCS